MRADLYRPPQRVIVKLGSQTVTHDDGGVDLSALGAICHDLCQLRQGGVEVVLVSSGAIQVGRSIAPGLSDSTMAGKQALSALGQPALMSSYRELFQRSQVLCAQVLVTHDDLRNRHRFLNARQTILELLNQGVLPILNENDSVSFSEITVGDNDQLAAMVCELVDGDLLLMLTGPDGLYKSDPNLDADAKPIKRYDFSAHDQEQVSTQGASTAGRGGMTTKLLAAEKLSKIGIETILCSSGYPTPILRALTSEVGTLFTSEASKTPLPKGGRTPTSRRAWLISIMSNHCSLEVDTGAKKALLSSGSLLPSGIIGVTGTFRRGDCIGIEHEGVMFACGLAEYDAKDIERIMGLNSNQLRKTLGFYFCDEVIHRDHFTLK
ncbi:MAG: glutamate 5-kinase [Pseudobacteriovorax sp.]|nr:glutamate 5-kinase [Pseudobacteriovorax sp.]